MPIRKRSFQHRRGNLPGIVCRTRLVASGGFVRVYVCKRLKTKKRMTMRTTMKASRCSRNTWFSPQLFTMRTTRCFLYILLLIISYFVVIEAQQSPFYQVAKFDSSVSYRTNVCERQRKLYADNISLSDALQGLSLSVVLTNYQAPGDTPFFTLTNDTNIIDPDEPLLFAIILDELAERAGFTWRNSFGTVLPIDSSTDGNKTWTDLLEWEVETFDLRYVLVIVAAGLSCVTVLF